MTWVKLDEQFARHPKVLAARPLGMAMQVAALCYCNEYLTDGLVPHHILPTLLNLEGLGMNMWKGELIGSGDDATWHLIVDDLIEAGLWKEAPGGYQIHDFEEYQPSRSTVLKEREDARKRQQSKRQRDANANGTGHQ